MPETTVLDCPVGEIPDSEALIEAAMQWHFDPRTGSTFWLRRARLLDFDPRRDVRSFGDLARFPNVVDELRTVPYEELIPRGYGGQADIVGVFESGGTTGAPKRVVYLADWFDRLMTWMVHWIDARQQPRDVNWLAIVPSGPHFFGQQAREAARRRGGYAFMVDFDPRWVKKSIAAGRLDEVGRYADHLLEQAEYILQSQRVEILMTTPPIIDRLTRSDHLVDLVNASVKAIQWGGASMDADTRHLLRTEVFPGIDLAGGYGSTMVLGSALERPGLRDDDPCIFDPFSPYVSFAVVDPESAREVGYGQRGQVVMHHISKSMFVPNNLERDTALRIPGPPGQVGDSVADVSPVAVFANQVIVEGVY
jgi:phenylacetate-coenzyme A ligase PaaK-like adenylate-forming protein